MNKSEEYLTEIRKADGLSRAVLKKITVQGNTAAFFLVTDLSYTQQDIEYAKRVTQSFLPEGLEANVSVMKSVPSEEGVRKELALLLKERFPSAAAFVSPEDIAVSVEKGAGRFSIGVMEEERSQFNRANVLDNLTQELNRRFCGVWCGGFHTVEKERGEIEKEELPPEETLFAPRIFEIADYEPIDGANPTSAIYIGDLLGEMQNVTVCGTITYVEERETKSGKPYFSFTITDGSGQMRLSYFSKKATVEKVRALKKGDSVCFTGENELFNGGLSFRSRLIDKGNPPQGFVPEPKPSRPAPANYISVFPQPLTDQVQSGLFGQADLPQSFRQDSFVVFDLETTGLNSSPAGGVMDRIIEIGAVKIVNGSVVEKFSSFVGCPVKLSAEIVKITGITDDMLVGAPPVENVIADFYKFAEGSYLVGHNVQFDYGFIRHYGEKEGFLFQQRQYDTLSLGQELLRLKNYKLNTIADYFGFTFNHHRAFDDAFVTAKIFIELVRLKGGL